MKYAYMTMSLILALCAIYGFVRYGLEEGHSMLVLSLLCRIIANQEARKLK